MPIQGTNADMLKVAMAGIRHRLSEAGQDAWMVNCVHDEILLEAEEGEAWDAAEIVREEMVKAGELPACAKSCPTGAITFGDLDKITAAAKARLAVVKKAFPKAQVLSLGDVRVLFLVTDKPERYAKYAAG